MKFKQYRRSALRLGFCYDRPYEIYMQKMAALTLEAMLLPLSRHLYLLISKEIEGGKGLKVEFEWVK